MKRIALTLLFMCALSGTALAQDFVVPITGAPSTNGSYLVLEDGSRHEGKVKMATMMGAYIKSFTFVTDSGDKIKVKAEDVQQLGIKINGMLKFMMVGDALGDPKNTPWARAAAFRSVNWEQIIDREHAIFDQAVTPAGNPRLLQLLNPGFESRIKVYVHFKKIQVGNSKKVTTYLLVKDGARPFVVKKGDYEEQFPKIFGDCSEFIDSFEGTKPRFHNIAGHIAVYDSVCPPEE